MNEIWKDIPGYAGQYRVSNHGNVFSSKSNKFLKPTISNTGYAHVQLYDEHRYAVVNVHRLVADAFLPNQNRLPEINHIDGDKLNNHVDNLEWVSRSDNQKHAIKSGLRTPSPKIRNADCYSVSGKIILQYSVQGDFIRAWDSFSEAAHAYDCSVSTISSCVCGKIRSCRGFIWKSHEGGEIQTHIQGIIEHGGKSINRNHSQKTIRISKPIAQYSKDGSLISVWESYKDIVAQTGFDNGNIFACINGRRKTAYGFIWKYAE